jgi:hypothetical protein
LLLLRLPHPCTLADGCPSSSAGWQREERGESGNGKILRGKCGRLRVVGITFVLVVVAASFCCRCRGCFWPLPRRLSPPATTVIGLLIVRLSVLPMPRCWRHICSCRRCSPMFAPIPPPPQPIVVLMPPSLSASLPPGIEGAPAPIVVSHAATKNGDGQSPLRYSYS